MKFVTRFKSYFLRGLAVLLPTILTIWIFVWGYKFIQGNISVYINEGLVRLIIFIKGYDEATSEALRKFWVEGAGSLAGFIVALVGVCIIGAMLASVVGRTLWRIIEKFIMSTPFLKEVYPYIKQITDFVFAEDRKKKVFSKVVAVEYPRKGVWSIGMVTGTAIKDLRARSKDELLTVLIPTSPTPFTGFVIMVPKKDTIELDITIEEAFRFTVSGGVITPGFTVGEQGLLSESEEN